VDGVGARQPETLLPAIWLVGGVQWLLPLAGTYVGFQFKYLSEPHFSQLISGYA